MESEPGAAPSAKRPKVQSGELPSAKCEEDGTTKSLPTICLMGATGVGKGSTLNSCFRSSSFSVGHMFVSDTVKPAMHVLPWRATGALMRGVDLCGFSDSEGRDTRFIESMVSYLRSEVKYVHCFLLLFNSQEARIGVHLKDMLMSLKAVFGLSFMKNVMIGFTRWDYTKRAAILRRGITKDVLSTNVNALLKDVLGHDHDPPCVFIDNTVNTCTAEELQELYGGECPAVTAAFDEALESIRSFAVNRGVFQCAEIEGTLAERDIGRDIIKRESAAYAEGAAAFEGLQRLWDELDVDEPDALLSHLQATAQTRRGELKQYLEAKTRPDLEHVQVSVLKSFDSNVHEEMQKSCWRNASMATSFNRQLRQELVEGYAAFVGESSKKGPPQDPFVRFREVCQQDRDIIRRYLDGCKGGSLAWGAFTKLLEQLRWEQLVARQGIFGAGADGSSLPELREFLSTARDLVAFLGQQSAPEWLMRLESTAAR